MAMLAGPRQRKRYNLVPKGKALFEDGDRFGTKMLEKMGWTKGKGLGSKENGQQEFIRIRYKNDANGLGFEDRDDQWTEHEKHFNGLLESLHTGDSNSNEGSAGDCDDAAPRVGFGFEKSKGSKDKLKDKFSGQSLEERSKKSKARVHYKKFTKGKDMAQYSEKDLANIFGKKATPNDNDFYSQLQSFNAGSESSEDSGKQPPIELGTNTINTGLSVSDYFKMKMEALKNKKNSEKKKDEIETNEQEENAPQSEVIDIASENDEESTEKSRRKKKKNKHEDVSEKENGLCANSEVITLDETQTEEVIENAGEDAVILKSKKKKSKRTKSIEIDSNSEDVIALDDGTSEEPRQKRKKKKNTADDSAADQVNEQNSVSVEKEIELHSQADEESASVGTIPSKKKKSKKHVTEDIVEEQCDTELASAKAAIDELAQKKKKNKKRKAEDAFETSESCANDQTHILIKKKKTKGPPDDEPGNNSSQLDPTENPPKKKKNKQQPSSEETPIESTENYSKKSKKKNKTETTNDMPVKVSSQHEISRLTDCYLDTYTISTFCAEKFRNVDLESFHDSNASKLIGYGLSENLELKIVTIDGDQDRITRLWSGTSNKYQYALPKREIYQNYMTKAKQAKRERKRIPKMKVKPLHRLNAFQSL